MRPIGIFGGTFDPIHYGHLRTALELQQRLELAAVHFVPVANPPHRSAPLNDGELRLRMVEAAIHGDRPTEIYAAVNNGVLAFGMPAWGPSLGPDKTRDVTAFVLTLKGRNVPGKAPQGPRAPAAPDATKPQGG